MAKIQALLAQLKPEFKKYITPTSWIVKAQENLTKIITVNEIHERWLKDMGIDISPIPSEEQVYEFSASILELDDLCEILEWRKKITGTSLKAYEDNLRQVLKMPLTVDTEDSSIKNQGRNKFFELKLFIRFKKAGYSTELGDNPDLVVIVNERKYSIECKRIFTKDRYIYNINEAIKKLKEHSLGDGNTLGIVAIDYSRYFFEKNHQIHAQSEVELKNLFKMRDDEFVNDTKDKFESIEFSPLVPFLFLNHKGMGYVRGLPYSINHMNIQETDYLGVRAYKDIVEQDFGDLRRSVNGK